MLQRREAQPGGKLSSGAELVWIGDGSGERCGTDGAHPRDRCKPPGDVAGAMPSEELTFDLPQPPTSVHGNGLCSRRRVSWLSMASCGKLLRQSWNAIGRPSRSRVG